ncbi:hypothetical protein IF1G_00885 [Cordyceps javanica]|uniref:Uncharacterized protein n=1 Tax=Cordyceps javanica TaxID=43265 RepID=A0A545VGU6_9HYPO|nr:hypothetical protein IF1G_00885 [Cordyceps javanica]
MLSIIAFVAGAGAMPIATEAAVPLENTTKESLKSFSEQTVNSVMEIVQRSVCELDSDSATPRDCPHVNSILRAVLALFCLFVLLVLLHVWQAAKYNKIQPVFGSYVVDDADNSAKIRYILLEETASP